MTWADARARIKTDLESVSITSPITQTMARVYETAPDTIQDLPCCVIKGESVEVERGSALRNKTYTVHIDLLVHDQDNAQQLLIVDAYREAIIDTFDQDITLNGTAMVIGGPAFDVPTPASIVGYGDGVAIQMQLTVRMTGAVAFAA